MAKIIVTGFNGIKYLVDSNSKFETSTRQNSVLITTGTGKSTSDLYLHPIKEPMEEIQKLINEVEAEATNAKLDLILENQEKIMKALRIQ